MKRLGRVVVLAVLVLALGAFGGNDARAICGFPGIVSASAFAGGTGVVILFNPAAPFNYTGMASVALGGIAGEKQFDLWLAAITDTPTNYLSVIAPAPAACGVCAMAPPGPFPNCPAASISLIFD